ncbi:MAG: type II toxin-antitoxin system RelE/ParE family toxin [Acidobacteria bacterium]|nr:type II toxin-antitoxin system RelE/ParE family toxin [Acidobacteriota bacterium]
MRLRHKGLRRFYENDDARGLAAGMTRKLGSILAALDAAQRVDQLDNPGYRLHRLEGDLAGLWSIRVTGNWRLVFRFEDGEAVDVDLLDYH